MDIEKQMDEDAKALAELGYTQELHRGMSAFSNFAVSFSIILILAGCITSYGIALVSGAPSTLVLGWLIVGLMVMAVAMSMADVVRVLPRQRTAWFARLVEGEPAHRDADQLHLALRGAVDDPRLAGPDQSGGHWRDLHLHPVRAAAQVRGDVDAILGGDANRARRMMESHCDDTAALLRGLLG